MKVSEITGEGRNGGTAVVQRSPVAAVRFSESAAGAVAVREGPAPESTRPGRSTRGIHVRGLASLGSRLTDMAAPVHKGHTDSRGAPAAGETTLVVQEPKPAEPRQERRDGNAAVTHRAVEVADARGGSGGTPGDQHHSDQVVTPGDRDHTDVPQRKLGGADGTPPGRTPPGGAELFGGEGDGEVLRGLVERRLVKATRHPTEPLTIYDYIGWAQRKKGNPAEQAIVEQCRGLIINDNGEVVARPFPAIKDLRSSDELPAGNITVTDKLDGTLGIQYFVDGVPYLATRRAFEDPYGRIDRATGVLRQYAEQYEFRQDVTYLWESIDPLDRHIVNYGDRTDLTLLAMIETATGRELPLPNQSEVPFPVVQTFPDIQTTDQLRETLRERPDTEGFVIRMNDTGKRYRLKTELYEWREQWRTDARRGKMSLRIWRHFLHGGSADDLLSRVPDYDVDEVRRISEEFQVRYGQIEQEAREGQHPQIRAMMRGKRDYSRQVWERMKPQPPETS